MTLGESMDELLKLLDDAGFLAGLGAGAEAASGGGPVTPAHVASTEAGISLYPRSVFYSEGVLAFMARIEKPAVGVASGPWGPEGPARRLILVSREPIRRGFDGGSYSSGGYHVLEVVPSAYSVSPLWELAPWTRPRSLRDRRTTIGMGDRTGLATPGQLRAISAVASALADDARAPAPVLAQQSIRELDFTGRSFPEVVADAAFGVFQAGYRSGYGADGDHLKTLPDIDRALSAGMRMITLDLTEVMRPEFADTPATGLAAAFAALPEQMRRRILEDYAGRRFDLGGAAVELDEDTAMRCALMYGPAIEFTERVDAHLRRRTGDSYDLEVSIDETTTPTLPSHHYFIARELERRGVRPAGVAPRFVGEFQKAVDYRGDLGRFAEDFALHCAIAGATGGYKISVHSGSDKLSVYPAVAELTGGRFHLKTSGTSWLESLRTLAIHDPELYRRVHRRAEVHFETARKAYHIDADPARNTSLDQVRDDELPAYLDDENCRQFLHISYGGLLRDPDIRDDYFRSLNRLEEEHYRSLSRHFGRHFSALGYPAN